MSREVIERAGFAAPPMETRRVRIPSVSREIEVIAFRTQEAFDALIMTAG
jgi:hypothetical protein